MDHAQPFSSPICESNLKRPFDGRHREESTNSDGYTNQHYLNEPRYHWSGFAPNCWPNSGQKLPEVPNQSMFPSPKRRMIDLQSPSYTALTGQQWMPNNWAPAVTPQRFGSKESFIINQPSFSGSKLEDLSSDFFPRAGEFYNASNPSTRLPSVTPGRAENVNSETLYDDCPIDATRTASKPCLPSWDNDVFQSFDDKGNFDFANKMHEPPSSSKGMSSFNFSDNFLSENQSGTIHDSSPFTSLEPDFHSLEPNALTTVPTLESASYSTACSLASIEAIKDNTSPPEKLGSDNRFKPFHAQKWNEHFSELKAFKAKYGHCLVPHCFEENQNLARWVKRQRRQYKLLNEGKASTMTKDRIDILKAEGFVWDSHEVVWMERYEEICRYSERHNHCCVPSHYKENPQLGSWVKCQRRQYKLFWDGKSSSMTTQRMNKLDKIGFVWEVRSVQKKNHTISKNISKMLRSL